MITSTSTLTSTPSSAAAATVAWVAKLGAKRVNVVGSSFGARPNQNTPQRRGGVTAMRLRLCRHTHLRKYNGHWNGGHRDRSSRSLKRVSEPA